MNHGGNRVLEDELFLVIGFQHQSKFVETLDFARQFHAAHEVDGDRFFSFLA